jgi:UDP-GlcNAc:undecaprenyl-phosphate GlcNAc-1-phosphate transferase
MGDTGSMFLGFTIASVAVIANHKSTASITLLVPIIALGIPIVDTSLSFIRRLWRRQHPFKADRSHIHHWLIDKDFNVKQVVLILLGVTVCLNLVAVFLAVFR